MTAMFFETESTIKYNICSLTVLYYNTWEHTHTHNTEAVENTIALLSYLFILFIVYNFKLLQLWDDDKIGFDSSKVVHKCDTAVTDHH